MRNYVIQNFSKGIINSLEPRSIPDGSSSAAHDWITKGDKIELRRGSQVIGTTVAGSGRVMGIFTARKADGTEILYRARGAKVEYYNTATSDWTEVGTDILTAAAVDDDISFAQYDSPAGAQLWFSSANSSLFKIMLANPGSYTDMYDASKNFKGHIKIKFNRMFLWGTKTDKTGLYGSHIDSSTNYTTVTNEVLASGNGVLKTFAGTLAFKAAGAKRTCMGLSVTDGTETFTDNFNGVLTGSAGGTGTINYTSGAYSVTFNAAPANTPDIVKGTYQWEDSTVNGIADFTKTSPTRVKGEGFILRQDDAGGDLQNVMTYGEDEYCIHEFKTWKLTIGLDDTTATNVIYRERVGIPNWRGAIDTGNGIYYVDDSDNTDPRFRVLTLDTNSGQVVPAEMSSNLDLTGYLFDKAVVYEWGDYILFVGRKQSSTTNDTLFLYNKVWKAFDIASLYASCLATYGGLLIGGDSITNNVSEFFTGFDDDNVDIDNSWEGNLTRLGVSELKKLKDIVIDGYISPSISVDVYLNTDLNGYLNIGTISGTGSYIDAGDSVTIGSSMLGTNELGGGSSGITANHYKCRFHVRTNKFDEIMIKFVASGTGYVSVSELTYFDILLKGVRIPIKYRT